MVQKCCVCNSENLNTIDKYENLNRVTSDCKNWPSGGKLLICRNCSTVQKEINAKWYEEVKKIYEQYDIYNQSSGLEQKTYDYSLHSLRSRSEKILSYVIKNISLPESGCILDIGCGNGAFLKSASKLLPIWSLSGSEINNKYEPEIRQIKNFESLYTCKLDKIPGKFDIISLIHVLEHINQPLNFLSNVMHKLANDGMLIIEIPNYEQNPFDFLIVDHAIHFSRSSILYLLEKCQYNIVLFSNSIVSKEITIVVSKSSNKLDLKETCTFFDVKRQVERAIKWLIYLKDYYKQLSIKTNFGIFGTSIGATWLYGELDSKVKFFVDEDNSRVNRKYMNCPVYFPKDIPKDVVIILPFLPEIANKIKNRLNKQDVDLNIIIPAGLSDKYK